MDLRCVTQGQAANRDGIALPSRLRTQKGIQRPALVVGCNSARERCAVVWRMGGLKVQNARLMAGGNMYDRIGPKEQLDREVSRAGDWVGVHDDAVVAVKFESIANRRADRGGTTK